MFILVNFLLQRNRFFFISFSDTLEWWLVGFGLPNRPVVISFPCGILWSFIVLLPSLSCGLICRLLCKSMTLVAMQPCSQQTQQDSQNTSHVKTCKERFSGLLQASELYFTSLGHFCNIRTFLCVFPFFSVFFFY